MDKQEHAIAIASTGTNDPTFDHALDIFAYHIGEIMTAREHVKVHFYGDVVGEYSFKRDSELPAVAGDSAYVDGH